MEWYYAKHGKQEGPVDLATLQGLLQSGQVSPTDLVWEEGMAEWTPAQNVPEVSAGSAPAASPAAGSLVTPQAGAGPPMASAMPQQAAAPVAHQHIPNYLVPAILVTIFCCWPFGIPAIVFAAKVDGMVSRGDIAEALEASNKAKTWTWVAFGCGMLIIVLYIIMLVVSSGNW